MKLFFDLDGTLTDPGVGITRCIEHALTQLGRQPPPRPALERLVGPPLRESFAELLGNADSPLVDEAITLYRQRFETTGMFENRVYPDVHDVLALLRAARHRCWVVTSKPRVYALQILQHFGLAGYFAAVFGSELSGMHADKTHLIRHVLAVDSETAEGAPAWMVGDRRHDIEAAHNNGLGTIGVLWGYGNEAELRQAGADRVVASMWDLHSWVTAQQRHKPVKA